MFVAVYALVGVNVGVFVAGRAVHVGVLVRGRVAVGVGRSKPGSHSI